MAIEQRVASREAAPRERVVLPYPASWVNRLMDWIESLPGPPWLYYLAVAAFFMVAYLFVQWRDSGNPLNLSQTMY